MCQPTVVLQFHSVLPMIMIMSRCISIQVIVLGTNKCLVNQTFTILSELPLKKILVARFTCKSLYSSCYSTSFPATTVIFFDKLYCAADHIKLLIEYQPIGILQLPQKRTKGSSCPPSPSTHPSSPTAFSHPSPYFKPATQAILKFVANWYEGCKTSRKYIILTSLTSPYGL